MGSPEEKSKRRKRIKVRSSIAKSLREPKFRQRIVKDKKGRRHDLSKMTHKDFVDAIQELNND